MMASLLRTTRSRLILPAVLYLVYIPFFLIFFRPERSTGQVVQAFSILPVIVVGYLFGVRGSMIGTVIMILLNMSLVLLAGPGLDYILNPIVAVRLGLLFAIAYVVGRMADLNRRLSIEVKRRRIAEREAREAAHAKSEFLAGMSHEIRTPMNAVIGMADLLDETELNETQRQYVGIFRSAGAGLLNIINDILDFSRFDSGEFQLESREFDLDEFMREVESLLAVQAHKKGLELNGRMDPTIPWNLIGDPVRLKQILVNLIGNGIKFTEQGEVNVSVDVRERRSDGITLLFRVQDTGIGIAPERIKNIFERFYQVDSSSTRSYGGTGLGLSIARKLVRLFGGSIEVRSNQGEGTIVEFTANFGIGPDTEPVVERKEATLDGRKILIVDDNDTNRLILNEILRARGAEVVEARGGEQGVGLLREAMLENRPFDLLLLDQRMPEIDGFETARRIKATPDIAPTTIMMLTSDSRTDDARKVRELGMSAYLVKPVGARELLREINVLERKIIESAKTKEAKKKNNSEPGERLKLLVVEDNNDNTLLLKAFLSDAPLEVVFAENGRIALDEFKEAKFDLIIMDIQMPVMDGYTAVRAMRAIENEKVGPRTPIIALTAYALPEEQTKSVDAGFDAHLTKPIRKQELLDAIGMYRRSE